MLSVLRRVLHEENVISVLMCTRTQFNLRFYMDPRVVLRVPFFLDREPDTIRNTLNG